MATSGLPEYTQPTDHPYTGHGEEVWLVIGGGSYVLGPGIGYNDWSKMSVRDIRYSSFIFMNIHVRYSSSLLMDIRRGVHTSPMCFTLFTVPCFIAHSISQKQ